MRFRSFLVESADLQWLLSDPESISVCRIILYDVMVQLTARSETRPGAVERVSGHLYTISHGVVAIESKHLLLHIKVGDVKTFSVVDKKDLTKRLLRALAESSLYRFFLSDNRATLLRVLEVLGVEANSDLDKIVRYLKGLK